MVIKDSLDHNNKLNARGRYTNTYSTCRLVRVVSICPIILSTREEENLYRKRALFHAIIACLGA